MKNILFIDRDGTLILEPADEQVDSLEKLEFYPEVFYYLKKIVAELNFELVMVTNQDGLGTDAYPESNFWIPQNFMLKAFKNEGINFSEILIDRTFAAENAPTRKPNTGLLTKYFSPDFDLQNSFVIGDRLTDMKLAQNLGSKGILINYCGGLQTDLSDKEVLKNNIVLETKDWKAIYTFLKTKIRTTSITRTTKETAISVYLNADGTGQNAIDTGLGFFDHMLEQIAKHAQVDLNISVKGDLKVDEHHTIEDVAIVLGQAFYEVLQDKKGMNRYGFVLPMDDCLAQVALDFGGRNWLVWEAEFKREKIGAMPTEMFMHFFKSFSDAAKCNLNIQATGTNEHHKIEGIFKAFAKALKMAIIKDVTSTVLPTTKGIF
ncbi:MAG: bifunctional histidinol-phosphatase/imidazoleglycerol-phosphate dehydratase [Flavobacteriales bacterium CG_4_9_14_0_2_um_filter_35_242]|nr:bifunctional histidinol-phosphatase/imidazoleglycerol-phosphate dehydratase HisB [Zetaproteobacteria bacterium]NDK17407.1 bifunctional histidinol-phosphatase/imidazoleglycerol-phosphate dehydratase HisB [Flavobacteriales bacterium]OIO10721.1 MAG: bifunctional imidazole glycerol-phosphate dehydratase/histidinol phosphatase [Flavobacteriaceae bacterium CG1_02_35_72]PIR12398.1 MAG: bifunctional histidinol-phosphatase/imidazoleglycerol-phosphate dehydratase [Flavobacteriales bacterium CG11_big_fi